MSIFESNQALAQLFEQHKARLCEEEGLTEAEIRAAIEAGTMVLLGNPNHKNVRPILVGQPARVKINANIGTSPFHCSVKGEMRKLKIALDAGADTVMDLSIAGDLDSIRQQMLDACPAPLGTVPMYGVAQIYIDRGEDPATIDPEVIFADVEKQAEQGVDFMTLHCGLTRQGAEWGAKGGRTIGIVSRGGSILSRWMLHNDKENPLLTEFDRILDIARRYNVTLSLGDGLRPGANCDSGDAAQWMEVIMLGQLAKRGLEKGVQCMIEGPGHVSLNEVEAQILSIKKLTHNAPLYVLGPLVTDTTPGYDHIAGAIGGALARKRSNLVYEKGFTSTGAVALNAVEGSTIRVNSMKDTDAVVSIVGNIIAGKTSAVKIVESDLVTDNNATENTITVNLLNDNSHFTGVNEFGNTGSKIDGAVLAKKKELGYRHV